MRADCAVCAGARQSCDARQAAFSDRRRAELHPSGRTHRAQVRRCGQPSRGSVSSRRAAGSTPRTGSGRHPTDGVVERERILAEARCTPEPGRDGAATWSLRLLQRALRRIAPKHFSQISTYTIRAVLQGAGCRWGRSRRWCETGRVLRKRKRGAVWVTDPDTEAKKS